MNSRNKEVEVKDLAIVGCGPAGLSAAVNAKATNTELQLFGSALCSPKMHKAPKVDNYLGFYEITGEELRKNFLEHVGHADIGVIKEKIDTIYSQKNYYTLVSRTELYHARAVILAVGTANPEYIEGEERYLGRGASYCATCDGPLYEDREVAVIAYTEEASREAEQLNEIASNVYYISQIDKDVSLPAEIQLIEDEPVEIKGEKMVHSIELRDGLLEVEGVFVIRPVTPPDKLIDNLKLENDHIDVDQDMRTNLPRIYAAGDCTGTPYQLARAVGQGQVAALSAVKDLRNYEN